LAHKGEVTIVVDAIAASAAATIFMAGDRRIMTSGSQLMMHDPSTITWGDAEAHKKTAEHLEKTANLLAVIYAEAADEDPAALRQEMKDEIWLDEKEALARGFATEASPVRATTVSAFNYKTFARAPQRLVALADEQGWTKTKTPPPTQNDDEENAMPSPATTQNEAADLRAELSNQIKARIQNITSHENAAGRETLATHLAYETELSVDDAVAILANAPKAAAAQNDEPSKPANDFDERRVAARNQAQPQAAAGAPVKPKLNARDIYSARAKA
jgi:ATP-dependent protease ClpP protease subunit